MISYTGLDRQGTARTGTTSTGNVAGFVETRYRQGWQRLVVRGDDGEQVGGIGPHPDTGSRTWWAEDLAA